MRFSDRLLRRFNQTKLQPLTIHQTPGIQLISLLVTLIILVLTHSLLLIWLIGLLTLTRICRLPSQHLWPLFKRVGDISIIAILLILPNFWLGQVTTTLLFIVRTEIMLLNIAFFLETITWPAFIVALRQLRLPSLLILTLEISLKYSHLLAQFLQESLWAIRLRSTGKSHQRQNLIGSLIGRLYLSSRDYIAALYDAMILRGYTGQIKRQPPLTVNRYDWRLIGWDLALFCLFCFIRR